MLKKAFYNACLKEEMKIESGFSLAIASQPLTEQMSPSKAEGFLVIIWQDKIKVTKKEILGIGYSLVTNTLKLI